MYRLLILLVLIFAASTVSAGDEVIKVKEVVVSATKIEESVDETTSSVIVVSQEKIEAKEKEFVIDVLRDIPEINVVQNGGPGKQATVILRGGSSTQTMVMIDGVQVKSTTLGSFDFSSISTDDVERIEIIKGPQSTIYGSEAMAGVINIITKKGKGKPKVEGTYEEGSNNTYNFSSTVSGGHEKLDYRVTAGLFQTDGISAVKKGTEKDGYENISISAKLGVRPVEKFELEISGRYSDDRSELDGFGADDLNYVQSGEHYLISGKGKLYLTDEWEQVLFLSKVKDIITNTDPDPFGENSEITTSVDFVDWQHNLYLTELYILTLGVNYRDEHGKNDGMFDKSVDNKAGYINNKLKLLSDTLVLNAGLRYDDHETFGNETTYRVGALYNIKPADLRVKGSYGTGFSAPTLNQLFYLGPWGSKGNPDLQPEKSHSWEVGIEKDIMQDRAAVSITYFSQEYENLIEWPETPPGSGIYQAQNTKKAEVTGFEARAFLQVINEISILASYSNIDTEDKSTGLRLRRRPKDKFNATLNYSKGPASVLVNYTHVGSVYESATIGDLPSYSLIDLSGSYKLKKNIEIFGRIDNVLNEDYEVAGGYGTPGISVFAGVRVSSL